MDVEADVVLPGDGRLTRVQAHPDANTPCASAAWASPAAATPSEARANATKNESPCVHLDSVVRGEGLAKDPPVLGKRLDVAIAELPEQPGRALDVGEEECDGS
jgi:hypothetical protein